jgi:hypothetical protein
VDPLADRYVGFSPYNYVVGNPNSLIDPDGMQVAELTAGGFEEYGANWAGLAGSDPCETQPALCTPGGVESMAFTASAGVGAFAFNFEIGSVISLDTGLTLDYLRWGGSAGVGASAGVEVTYQEGSLLDFLEGVDQPEANFVELAELELPAGFSPFAINLPVDAWRPGESWSMTGFGGSLGVGWWAGLNGVGKTVYGDPDQPERSQWAQPRSR